MKIIKRIGIICACIMVFALAALTFGNRKTSALGISDLEVQQAMLNGLYNCYNSGAIRNKVSLASKDGYFTYDSKYSIVSGTGASVSLPTYFSGMSDTRQINCSELLFGATGDLTTNSSEFPGIFKANGISTPSSKTDLEGINSFMTGMGYIKEDSHDSGGKTCIGIYFTDSRKGDSNNIVTSDLVCFLNLSDGKITQATEITLTDNGIDYDHDPLNITLGSTGIFGSGNITINVGVPATKVNVTVGEAVYGGSGSIANEILSIAASTYKGNGCKTRTWTDPATGSGEERWTYCLAEKDGSRIFYDPGSTGMSSASYRIDDNNAAFNTARGYLKLPNTNGSYDLTQKFILYQSYLAQYYGLRVICGDLSDEEKSVAAGNGYTSTVYAYHEGKFQECLINIGNLKGNKKVTGFDGGHLGGTMSAEEVLAGVNNIRITSLSSEEASRIGKYSNGKADDGSIITDPSKPGTDPVNPVTGETETSDATDVCYGSPGTLGLGWILCPILSGASNTLNWFYNNIATEYMQVEVGIVTDNDVYKAWQTFQNIANVILVIFLLVVIFSQLTGIGIDNYGIKKILPRLIICAILINLSYFIAQLIIDASNIVGNSIGGLFGANNPGITEADWSGMSIPSNILGLTTVIAAGGGIAALVANPALLLSLLLVLISGLFAVIMMWVILIARKAGVVIAIIIAPLAFAMYLLPNTSRYTKSWANLMKSLLLLYPLAALLISASFFVSNLIADLGPNMILPAMILRVAPFFALPTLFRKSVDAMGNLGTRIQGFGRGLSKAATNATRNADWYKNAQERGLERRTRLRAGIGQDGNEATGWRGLLRSRSDRNRARYRQQYLKTQSEQEKAELLNSPEYLEAMRQKQELDRRAEQNEIDLMNSPDYRSAVRAKQDTDLEKKQTEAQASAITTGTFKRSDGADVNTSSLSALARALQYEASQDDDRQDISKIRALYDAILAKGDDGIDALANVWDSGGLRGKGLQRITESIASDGNIKAKARSLHAIANDVMSPSSGVTYEPGQISAARAAGTYASKIKPEMISNMTDNERDSYIQYANSTGDATAMRNIYLASQNINSFKPGEQRAVYDVADRYVQDHMELANTGTYINSNGDEIKLRRNADNVLVYDDGSDVPIDETEFKNQNFRLKRN